MASEQQKRQYLSELVQQAQDDRIRRLQEKREGVALLKPMVNGLDDHNSTVPATVLRANPSKPMPFAPNVLQMFHGLTKIMPIRILLLLEM